jgi:hypothetical protein
LGGQVGSEEAVETKHMAGRCSENMFRYNVHSFGKLWKVVGERTGTKWRVEGTLADDWALNQNDEESNVGENKWSAGSKRLIFAVIREKQENELNLSRNATPLVSVHILYILQVI